MFKVRINSRFRTELATKLRNTVDARFIQDMQREVVDGEIKRLIAAGVSPVDSVEGNRRFPGYKNPKKYPGDKKAKRPANLFLTGAMLSWYRAIKVSGIRLSIGIDPGAPPDVKVKALANNEGTVSKNNKPAIPPRRFIPLVGENFRVSVMRKLKTLYAQRIKALLSNR